MNSDLTAIYCTDSSAPDDVLRLCRSGLLNAGVDIVSVSQQPLDGFGRNVCVGDIGRSYLSLIRQLIEGVNHSETDYVAVTEHDCLYPADYFDFVCDEDDVFYYNKNHYYFFWGDGGLGKCGKSADKVFTLSQLICRRELLLDAMTERLLKAENGYDYHRHKGSFEPGFNDGRKKSSRWSPTPVMDIQHGCNYCIERTKKVLNA